MPKRGAIEKKDWLFAGSRPAVKGSAATPFFCPGKK